MTDRVATLDGERNALRVRADAIKIHLAGVLAKKAKLHEILAELTTANRIRFEGGYYLPQIG